MKIRTCSIAILILFIFSSPLFAGDCSNVKDQIAPSRNNPAALRALLHKAPRCGDIYEALGDHYYDHKVWNEAQENYKKALELLPGNKKILARLRELRPRTAAMIKNEKEMLAFRKGLGGMTESLSGPPSPATSPSPPEAGHQGPRVIASSRNSRFSASRQTANRSVRMSTRSNVVAKPAVRQKAPKVGLMINFAFDSAQLTPRGKKLLSDFAEVLNKELAGRSFLVEGNTDNVGGHQYNMRLSVARAQSVKSYLTRCGVDAARLYVSGFGPDRPLYDNATAEGRAKNRRVEFAEK